MIGVEVVNLAGRDPQSVFGDGNGRCVVLMKRSSGSNGAHPTVQGVTSLMYDGNGAPSRISNPVPDQGRLLAVLIDPRTDRVRVISRNPDGTVVRSTYHPSVSHRIVLTMDR